LTTIQKLLRKVKSVDVTPILSKVIEGVSDKINAVKCSTRK